MTTEEKLKAAMDAIRAAIMCIEEGNELGAIVLLRIALKQ